MFPVIRGHRQPLVRLFGSLLAKDASTLSVVDLQQHQAHADDDARVALIDAITASSNPHKQVLLQELIPNFAIYFKLDDIKSTDVLARFIEINPGRVYSTWDLFKKYESGVDTNSTLVRAVVAKMAAEEEPVDIEQLARFDYLWHKYIGPNVAEFEPEISKLLDKLAQDHQLVYLAKVLDRVLVPFAVEFLQNADNAVYLTVFQHLLLNAPELLEAPQFIRALAIINSDVKLPRPDNDVIQQFHPQYVSVDKTQLKQTMVKYIDDSRLDLADSALLLREALVESFGIHDANIDEALKRYHHYQTRLKYGLDWVQTALLKSFCYQAVAQDNVVNYKIAETLIPADLTVRVLQLLMVAQSAFDAEASLKWYNDYIQKVSRDVNSNNRSPAGSLTESLVLSSLYDNDRSFASLVLEKAVDNNVISNDHEIAAIKKVFKLYGDSFVDNDDWTLAKVNMRRTVLEYIKGL